MALQPRADAKLPIGSGGAVFVALFFLDGQGLAIQVVGGGKVALLLGYDSQLVIGAGRAVFVALSFLDGEGLAIPLLGGGKVALLFGYPSELVILDGINVLFTQLFC